MRDVNAKIGKKGENERTVRQFKLGQRNERGQKY